SACAYSLPVLIRSSFAAGAVVAGVKLGGVKLPPLSIGSIPFANPTDSLATSKADFAVGAGFQASLSAGMKSRLWAMSFAAHSAWEANASRGLLIALHLPL